MDNKDLNQKLVAIIEKRNVLSEIDYSDETYDQKEEELHDLEDEFLETYGEYTEEAIGDVYDEHCPHLDVLSPISYIGRKYTETGVNDEGKQFIPVAREGLLIELQAYPNDDVRLVLIPNPLRVVAVVNAKEVRVVWNAAQVSE